MTKTNKKIGFQNGHPFYSGGERGWFKKGAKPHNKGQSHPEWAHKQTLETKNKIRQSKLKLYKDKTKHPSWKGGISKDIDHIRFRGRIAAHKRRVLYKKLIGSHTLNEWETLKAQYNWTCPCCGKSEPEIKLTEDHIIPLSKGGSGNIENIQPLCKPCNTRKHTKIIKFKNNKK